jgi:hypothetical protein
MTADAAVAGIREVDRDTSIGIVGAESDPPYDRPPLEGALPRRRGLPSAGWSGAWGRPVERLGASRGSSAPHRRAGSIPTLRSGWSAVRSRLRGMTARRDDVHRRRCGRAGLCYRDAAASPELGSTRVVAVNEATSISPRTIFDAVGRIRPSDLIRTEGGPHLIGNFFTGPRLGDLFLTLAPQIAGRAGPPECPRLVAWRTFALGHPLWGKLVRVKCGESHSFLSYSFDTQE